MSAGAGNGRIWKRRGPSWALCLFYHGLVFYFSLLPSDRIPEILQSLSDKLLHAGEFFLLFLLTFHALSWWPHFPGRFFRAGAAALWALFLGGLIEVLQTHIPGRSGDIADFWADAAGVVAAIAMSAGFHRRRQAA